MAIVTLNPLFTSIHGRYGNTVFVHRRGKTHIRPYVNGHNPDTPAQSIRRTTFREAVRSWQVLSDNEKRVWNSRARGMPLSGYNHFISSFLLEGKTMCRETQNFPGYHCENMNNHIDRLLDTFASPSLLLRTKLYNALPQHIVRSQYDVKRLKFISSPLRL